MDPQLLQHMLSGLPPGAGGELEEMMALLRQLPPAAAAELLQGLPQELCGGAARAALPVAPGATHRQRVKANKEESARAYEHVLRQCCDASIVRSFEGMSADAREALLMALQSTVEDNVVDRHTALMMNRRSGAERTDSLIHGLPQVRAVLNALEVQTGRTFSAAAAGDVALAKLPRWGLPPVSKDATLRQMTADVEHHKRMLLAKDQHLLQRTNASVVKPPAGSSRHTWTTLHPIGVSGLKLFDVARGKVLSGVLAVPPLVNIGITTIMEDDAGKIVQLGLYNVLPGGATGAAGQVLADRLFPRGLRLRIAEPFFKVFKDGNVGVRVDDPGDVQADRADSGEDLGSIRSEANRLFVQKEYFAALDLYWRGLRGDNACSVAALLSNRAQALLKRELWAEALRDAAAALLMAPRDSKAWPRYHSALAGLGHTGLASRASRVLGTDTGVQEDEQPECLLGEVVQVLEKALLVDAIASDGPVDPEQGEGLKERGNNAYKERKYEQATDLYSAALTSSPAAKEVALLFSNMALCSIQTGALHDAAAAAAASLRLRPSEKAAQTCAKAIVLLRQPQLALAFLRAPAVRAGACDQLQASIEHLLSIGPRLSDLGCWRGVVENGLVPEWFDETAFAVERVKGKGRGLIALRDIARGEVVLVQKARGLSSCSTAKNTFTMSTNLSSRLIDDGSKLTLKAQLTAACASDALLASTLSCLSDGSDKELPVVSAAHLFNQLSAATLPFLPQQPQYVSPSERVEVSHDMVSAVVDINSHGLSNSALAEMVLGVPSTAFGDFKETALYPAVSLMNHARDPTCTLVPLLHPTTKKRTTGVTAVVAVRPLSRGTELTVSYHDDEAVLKDKWGIET